MGKHKINKTYIEKIFLVLILLFILANSYVYASQKNGYFLDEACTFLASNAEIIKLNSPQTLSQQFNQEPIYFVMDKWTGYDEIMDFYTTKNSGRFNFLNVYYSPAYDNHPPLFFACINIVSSLFPDMNLNWVGYLVNIIFLLATCICIYNICILVLGTNNTMPAMAAMLYYGLSYEFTNTATFYRMYAMLGFWLTLLLYVTIRFVKNDFSSNNRFLFLHCIIIFCAMLTQYFAVFYIFPIFFITLFLLIVKKKSVKKYVLGNIITGILYLLIWPASIYHMLFTNRGRDIQANITGANYLLRIKDYISLLLRSLFSGMNKYMLIFFIITLLLGLYSIWKIIKNPCGKTGINFQTISTYIYLFAPAIFYFISVSILSPWVVDRYQMPIMPILSILIVLVIFLYLKTLIKNNLIIYALLLSLPIILCFKWVSRYEPNYLYNDPKRSEYIANYNQYDAIVVSVYPDDLFVEIPINYPHANYLSTFDSRIDETIKKISELHSPLIVYLGKNCDEKTAKALQESCSGCVKLDYSTEFYDIYLINATDINS
jgi:hypothetical protein